MKYYETTFEEYVRASHRNDIHPEVTDLIAQLPAHVQQCPSMILYGPSGVGKYTAALRIIEKYSPSRLKFQRRIALQELSSPASSSASSSSSGSSSANGNNGGGEKEKEKDKEWLFRVSDIHYEVDFSMLGCESKKMWNDFFFQIADIVSVLHPERAGIILCHNFHCIHNELLDVFYSYMQHSSLLHIHLSFLILTQHISFLPSCIVQRCQMIPVARPSSAAYASLGNNTNNNIHDLLDAIPKDAILNLKEIKSFGKLQSLEQLPTDLFNLVCDNIVRHMDHMMTMDHRQTQMQIQTQMQTQMQTQIQTQMQTQTQTQTQKQTQKQNDIEMYALFRDCLYDILLYALDITECLWYIVEHYLETGMLQEVQLPELLDRMHVFLKYYNNNYRPIYHLESMFYYLIMTMIDPSTKQKKN